MEFEEQPYELFGSALSDVQLTLMSKGGGLNPPTK